MFVAHDPQLKTRRETHAQCLTHYFQKQYCFPSFFIIWCIMLLNSLFYILTTQSVTAQSSSFRGNFIPPETTATLLEGDILVPESHVGRGPEELDAFLSDPELLWPNGYVPYCFETFEWEGSKEPIFLDDQIANVTKALRQISKDVPCIKFKWVTSKNKAEN